MTGRSAPEGRTRRDALVVVAGAVAVWFAATNFDLFERFVDWVHDHEDWEIDEIIVVAMYLAVGLPVFIARRWRERTRLFRAHDEVVGALARREEELAATVESIPDPLFRLDASGLVLEARQTVIDETPFGGLAGRRVEEVFPRKQARQVLEALELVNRSGEIVEQAFEFPLWPGHEFWEARFVPVANGDVMAVTRDFTELRRQERQLVELLATKDEFIATVSHELRTPLTAVLGFAEVLQDESSVSDLERRQLMDAIVEQGRDMSHMIEDLLVGARIDSDTLALLEARVDLVAETRSVLNSLRGVIDPSVDVEPPVSAQVVGDPTRIRQILRNLITNATRYGGSKVAIRVAPGPEVTSLLVIDDGPGVPMSDTDLIFDPYHRAHQASGVTGSVGLGLTVSRRLARMMGGDVTYGRADGLTTFALTLPTYGV